MTSRQAKMVTEELETSSWSLVGFASDEDGEENEKCKVYQADTNRLFAIYGDRVFFEVYEEDGRFTVY